MKAAQMTREDEIRSISQKYEMDKEKVRDILERVVRYTDAVSYTHLTLPTKR